MKINILNKIFLMVLIFFSLNTTKVISNNNVSVNEVIVDSGTGQNNVENNKKQKLSPIVVASVATGLGVIVGAAGCGIYVKFIQKKSPLDELINSSEFPFLEEAGLYLSTASKIDKAKLEKILKNFEDLEKQIEKGLNEEKDNEKKRQLILKYCSQLSDLYTELDYAIQDVMTPEENNNLCNKEQPFTTAPEYFLNMKKIKAKITEILKSRK